MKLLPFFAALLLAALGLLLPTPAPADVPPAETPRAAPARSPRELIPPAPPGQILDLAKVLLPETLARLSARLVAARALDVHVYVVTVPSLKVPPSKQFDRLHEVAKDYSDTWIKHIVGAVILFDDEGGLITVELSKPTSERFSSLAVEGELQTPLGEAQKTGLARDKIERFGNITVEALCKFQEDYLKEMQHARIWNLVMGGIALLGLGLAVFSALGKPKGPVATAPDSPRKSPPPAES